MTRHSRNCTASSVYSYYEKKRDADASGYGSLAARYGKDGVKDFDCCCLSLHPCKDPMVSQEGYIFDREAIIQYILNKKNEIRKKIKEYEKQCKKDQDELEELGAAEERSRLEKFLKSENHPASSSSSLVVSPAAEAAGSSREGNSSISNMKGELAKKLPSYWIPSLTPDNKLTRVAKPEQKVLCPMSGKPLKMKDLVSVKFTRVDPNATFSSLEGHKERYKCPVTGDVLRYHSAAEGRYWLCCSQRDTGGHQGSSCNAGLGRDPVYERGAVETFIRLYGHLSYCLWRRVSVVLIVS
ncbi:Nitric oxide synthase-interacting protein zinc-finger [Trinorchestia longiramus]|nr:Nitric oxide synthase-interacting protein zinc-finger [Trinorchestia longiramus]